MIRVLGSNLALNSQRPGDPRADSTRAQAPPPSSRVGSRLPLVQGWESVAVAAPSSGRRPVFHFPLFCGRLPGGLRVQPIWVAPSPSRFAWNARVTLRSAGCARLRRFPSGVGVSERLHREILDAGVTGF